MGFSEIDITENSLLHLSTVRIYPEFIDERVKIIILEIFWTLAEIAEIFEGKVYEGYIEDRENPTSSSVSFSFIFEDKETQKKFRENVSKYF